MMTDSDSDLDGAEVRTPLVLVTKRPVDVRKLAAVLEHSTAAEAISTGLDMDCRLEVG